MRASTGLRRQRRIVSQVRKHRQGISTAAQWSAFRYSASDSENERAKGRGEGVAMAVGEALVRGSWVIVDRPGGTFLRCRRRHRNISQRLCRSLVTGLAIDYV
jgi:hypothetical protein